MIVSVLACFKASLLFLLLPVTYWKTPSTFHQCRIRSAAGLDSGNLDEVVPPLIVRPAKALNEAQQMALDRATAFTNSLLKKLIEIPESGGMHVMQQVYDPERGKSRDVVIRGISEQFWQCCLNVVDTPQESIRVCAVGTPGIGKSLSIGLLIRMLLLRSSNCTVVYLLRTPNKSRWYYEMQRDGNVVHIAVYPEKTEDYLIKSLTSGDTYYIVDPGTTKDSCGPTTDFMPKTIIVASPDERHWGESEFFKPRHDVSGHMLYFPVWTLEELLGARSILGPQFSEQAVQDRYRIVGGVPRFVFSTDVIVERVRTAQDLAIGMLTSKQVELIAFDDIPEVGTFSPNQPRSALIGLTSDAKDDFVSFQFDVISPLVAEKICAKRMGELWNAMLSRDRIHGGKLFEAYTRQLIASDRATEFEARYCVGKNRTEYKQTIKKISLGGCCSNRIQLSSNLTIAAANTPNVVYHPASDQYPLIDFMYRDEDGVFHAFQATIGESHRAPPEGIKALHQAVGYNQSLRLYYLVPAERFRKFVTDPIEPVDFPFDTRLQVYHVMVPNPKEEKRIGLFDRWRRWMLPLTAVLKNK